MATESATRRRTIIASVAGIAVVFTIIVLMVVFIPKYKKGGRDPLGDRIECPGYKDSSQCIANGCVFETGSRGPSCFMTKDSFGYKVVANTSKQRDGVEEVDLVPRSTNTPYGSPIQTVTFKVTHVTENIVRITFRDSESSRYEVPVQKTFPLLQREGKVAEEKMAYRVSYSNETADIFTFQVKRPDGTKLFDSSIGGLVMSDQFLQVAGYLPSSNVYGLGEHTHPSLRHDMGYVTWPLFARDQPPVGGKINLYGVHPFYTCLENTTKSHGVLFLNSNAMEVTLMPAPAISFRTVGGILDLLFFVGDNPEHVVQLYTSMVGRPMMPPYWGLGFQLSRYGYNNLSNVQDAVERTRNAGIAQDVQFLDIDHMNGNKDFTYDKERFSGLVEYVKKTQKDYGLKWIIILDPAIPAASNYEPYLSGLRQGVYVKRAPYWEDSMFPKDVQTYNVTYGKVWPSEVVAFPDFFLDKTSEWWIKNIVDYHKTLPFDGLWIDMNEPSNFGTNEDRPFYCSPESKDCWSLKCPESTLEDPTYNPLGSVRLSTMTLCMESVHEGGFVHYDVHSLYGWSQSLPTLKAAQKSTGGRSLVISRSTYPSSGTSTGHWLGDNKSTWEDLRSSIIGMLEFNLFGIPYIGADVCGFFEDTTDELCTRWMQLGAFYPFYRNHNGMGQKDQDPGALSKEVTESSRKAVERRYILQPYLYTLFFKAHTEGNTVLRPLFHEFPEDEKTWNNGEQFMWGKCLLVSPVLNKGDKSVSLYLPKGEWWYFKYEESTKEDASGATLVKSSDVSEDIPLHVRGGCIIPTEPYIPHKTGASVQKNISLYIFPQENFASGEVFVDDGFSINTIEKKAYRLYQFTYKNCSIEIKRTAGESGAEPSLGAIHVFKVESVMTVFIGKEETKAFQWNSELKVLTVTVTKQMKDVSKISWQDKDGNCQMLQ